jgi:ubiquinone/menaquinone biosynthesis C-methylase UbiE
VPALRALLVVLLAGPGFPAVAQDASPRTPHEMHQLHGDAQAYIAMLEDPSRDAYQKPSEVVAALALKAGEVVADVGAGSGYFALRLAQPVGPTGWVYAIDISPEMIVHLNRRVRDAGIQNLQTILAPPDDPLLRDASVDRFFICDTWHHISDQERYLARMKKMLRPGGQVVMIDFQKKELPLGPPLSVKIAREDLIRQMDAAGFRLLREHTFLPYQYFLVFTLKPSAEG